MNLTNLAYMWVFFFWIACLVVFTCWHLRGLVKDIRKAKKMREERARWWARFKDNLK